MTKSMTRGQERKAAQAGASPTSTGQRSSISKVDIDLIAQSVAELLNQKIEKLESMIQNCVTKPVFEKVEVVKNVEGAKKVFTRDGNIHCDFKGKHFIISSPDDLFHLGIDVDENLMEELGLKDFL